jgi:hypothetical protein
MSAQLHRHILVVYHLHPGDILFYPVGLELILLPVGQEVVDRVLQSTLIATDPRCDGLPGDISNSIAARSLESGSLVSAEDSRSVIPRSEIVGTKPPYVCPGCFIHTYSNNMINRFHVQ